MKSPKKTRLKDQRSPIRPPTSTHFSPNKKTLKDKQKSKLKLQETENIETLNKSSQLEKMEIGNSPQETKTKSLKNKPSKSSEQRTTNEQNNNSVKLPWSNTKNDQHNITVELQRYWSQSWRITITLKKISENSMSSRNIPQRH